MNKNKQYHIPSLNKERLRRFNERYNLKDKKELSDILTSFLLKNDKDNHATISYKNYGYILCEFMICDPIDNKEYNYKEKIEEMESILFDDFENVVSYIGSRFNKIRLLAKWRLKIGK